jgi:hypothetical protein
LKNAEKNRHFLHANIHVADGADDPARLFVISGFAESVLDKWHWQVKFPVS